MMLVMRMAFQGISTTAAGREFPEAPLPGLKTAGPSTPLDHSLANDPTPLTMKVD
jgi:hypothetical protein